MTKLTRRDVAILRSCAVSHVLTTTQARRWHFGSASVDAAQKRLRKLAEAGYLDAIETRTCTDNLYRVGKEGRQELEKRGLETEARKDAPKDLSHHLGVTDIRIAIEQGMARIPGLYLRYIYSYWELGQFAWPYPIIPDAIFSIRNAYVAQAAIEFDRNTESLAVFAKKLGQYRTLMRLHPVSTVILVVEHQANVERIGKGLREVETRIPLLTLALEDLKHHGLLALPHPRPHMFGARTVAEQMEIDVVRLQEQIET